LLLAAGLDGIKKKREPIQPTVKNIEKLTDQERKEMGITQLPSSLSEALDHLESSKLVSEVLGKDSLDIFLEVKRKECKEYSEARSISKQTEWEWEYLKYLERS